MSARVLTMLGLLWALPSLGMGPFHENPPEVVKGLVALEANDPEAALEAFDAAKARLGSRPELEHNRALALSRMGKREEAAEIFGQLAGDTSLPKPLRAKAAYQLGNVHAAASARKEAMSAYRKALTLDPTDAEARHNLEVLLRNVPPPNDSPQPDAGQKDQEPDGGTPDAGQDAGDDAGEDGGQDAGDDAGDDAGQDGGQDGGDDAGQDGGQDGGDDAGQDGGDDAGQDGGEDGGQDGGTDAGQDGGDGGQDAGADAGDAGDAGSDAGGEDGGGADAGGEDAGEDGGADGGADGGEGDGGEDGGQPADAGQDAGADAGGSAGAQEQPLDPEAMSADEAEQLLDAMKQDERNLQLWRFQQKVRPRNADQKDW